jgi:hypothetical protein
MSRLPSLFCRPDHLGLTGARTETGRVSLVGAVAHGTGAVIGQTQVPDKRGEGEAAHTLLTQLALPGWVFTLDALHTTRKTARLITDRLDAHYVLILKGNQLAAACCPASVTVCSSLVPARSWRRRSRSSAWRRSLSAASA